MSLRSPLAALVLSLLALSASAIDCDRGGTTRTNDACRDGKTEKCLEYLVPYLNTCSRLIEAKVDKGDTRSAREIKKRFDDTKAQYGDFIAESERMTGFPLKGPNAKLEDEPGRDIDLNVAARRRAYHEQEKLEDAARLAKLEAAKALESGDSRGALKALNTVLKTFPDDPVALSQRAQARLADGDRAGALADAKRAAELNPQDGASRALVSEISGLIRSEGKIGKSKLDFGAQRAPEDAGAGGGRFVGAAGTGPAERAAAGGANPAPAGGAGGSGARAGGDAGGALGGLIDRAHKLIAIGDLTGALLPLREAIDQDPKRVELWDMLADVSNKLGNPAGALDAAEHALALNPQDARALRAKSYAEFQLGRYAEAKADADKAIALEPGSGLAYLYRAMAEEKLGESEKALADFRTAVRLDPSLEPLTREPLARLGGGAAPAPARGRLPLRVGAIGLSTLLIVLGLMGTATGRALTRRALTPRPPVETVEDEAPVTMQPGDRIGGNYRVVRELGRGGMGVVYLAQDEALQRPVAIKQLQREGRGNAEDLERFLREARLVAQLKHPHMAQIHSVVSGADLLLVFEYVEGEPLDRTLGRDKRLTPARTRELVTQICDALQYAHERKIVHRDLKPANVMIDASGSAKVMDFGIAHQSRSASTMTQTSVSGTPPYMSPEQGFGSVSKSSDLYALAVMTYEMLTGVRPFSGPDFLEPKLRKEFTPASRVNAALGPAVDAFFDRALEPDPTKRPPDAAAFAFELGRALSATPSRA